MKKIFPILTIIISSIFIKCYSKKVLSCYVMSWSVYRDGLGKFDMRDIDPYMCTHIIYGYRELNTTTWQIQSGDAWADHSLHNMEQLVNLKRENPDLKILSSIGGWNQGSEIFSNMVSDKQRRRSFVESVVKHLQHYKLDGFDMDWQFPTKRGGKPEDKENFVSLLKELRHEFDKSGYLLTVRLVTTSYFGDGYDLPGISEAVHYINLKSYSYHGYWDKKTGVASPLNSQDYLNVEHSVNYFIEQGVAREKMLLGLTTEGSTFILESPVTNGNYLNQPASEGFSGPWLKENGYMGFNEMCWELTNTTLWTEHWDEESQTPYATKDNMMVSYDNPRSFKEKMKLIDKKNLAGASFFSLDTDDFKGQCYNEKFIMTYAVKSSLIGLFNLQTTVVNKQYPL